MAADPTAAYRKQQGMAPVTQSYDPVVVGWVVKAAKQTGADPAALLATAIQESGARRGAVGDNGTSFGPWQMHQGGALGSHNAAWANSYATALNRAQEFARLQVHGGPGAAAVQRPADRSLYATGVNSHLEQARAILAHYGLTTPTAPVKTLPATPPAPLITTDGIQTNDTANIGNSLIQSILDQNAKLAGIQNITLPVAPVTQTPVTTTTPGLKPTPAQQAAHTLHPTKGIYQHANWAGADQGVDFRGKGAVTALADAVVTRVETKSSWIGAGGKGTGAIVSYRITSGPYAGRHVYVAENITPRVQVGQRVRAGQPIATAHGSFPYTESGWANSSGSPIAALGTSNTGRDFAKSWGLA